MKIDAAEIHRLADELGFALCGVAPAAASDHIREFHDWLDAGKHGSMGWLADHVEQRMDPGRLLEDARSVICVADWIGPPAGAGNSKFEIRNSNEDVEATGRIARYAQVDDYHKIIKKRLHVMADRLAKRAPDDRFRTCVDTAPLLEREHAARAGLGWIGKNTLLLHPRLGSHLLLGAIVTTLDITPTPEHAERIASGGDHCGTCTRCIDACPTGCIEPYTLDASRCISYLTIEHRPPPTPTPTPESGDIGQAAEPERMSDADASIPEDLIPAIGDWLYGCDVCQDVCPYNQPRRMPGDISRPDLYGDRPAALDLFTVLGWTAADRTAAFTRSAMKRARLDQMKRNALLVAENHLRRREDSALRRRIEQLAESDAEAEWVRRTAAAALDRLNKVKPAN